MAARFYRGRVAKQWGFPHQDPTLLAGGFQGQDEKDPRAQGRGPCGDRHKKPLTADTESEGAWAGSQYGRWIDCEVCALRLGYWPREPYTGRYRQQIHPMIVEVALGMIRSNGDWKSCTQQKMMACIRKAQAEQTLRGLASAEERQPRKGKGKPGTKGMPGSSPGQSQGSMTSPQVYSLDESFVFADAGNINEQGLTTMKAENKGAREEEEDERMTIRELRAAVQELQRENRALKAEKAASSAPEKRGAQ